MISEKYNNIISVDFQGWPIYKLNLRDILLKLGAKIIDGRIGFDENDKILDIFPVKYEDDGMGYGINEQFITDVDHFYTEEDDIINIWTETPESPEKIDSFIKECKDLEQQFLVKFNK